MCERRVGECHGEKWVKSEWLALTCLVLPLPLQRGSTASGPIFLVGLGVGVGCCSVYNTSSALPVVRQGPAERARLSPAPAKTLCEVSAREH